MSLPYMHAAADFQCCRMIFVGVTSRANGEFKLHTVKHYTLSDLEIDY